MRYSGRFDRGRAPLNTIGSLWVRRDHSTRGAIVGSVWGAAFGALAFHAACRSIDIGPGSSGSGSCNGGERGSVAKVGAVLGFCVGAVLGSRLGENAVSWHRRWP